MRRLAEQIRHDHGRVDLLVKYIWAAEVLKGAPAFAAPSPPATWEGRRSDGLGP